MKKIFSLTLVAFIIIAALAFRLNQNNLTSKKADQTQNTVTIGNKTVMVDFAQTPEEVTLGLGRRESLEKNQGMLFIFPKEQVASFWMKGMLIPIDIIWINDGIVMGIEKNVQPQPDLPDYKLDQYPSPGIVDYVLEVNAGFSDKNNINIGDSVKIN